MNASSRGGVGIRLLACAALALVLAVVFASAALRQGAEVLSPQAIAALRIAHRSAASLEVLVLIALAWTAWRSPAVLAAAALTVMLSVVGIAAGRNPPPAAALANILGGLALAACFAWLLGSASRTPAKGRRGRYGRLGALLAAQCALGAVLSVYVKEAFSLVGLVHALLGAALAAGAARLALRLDGAHLRFGLLGLALAVPATGFAAALFGLPFGATLAHAGAVALLLSIAAYAHAKRA